MTRGLVVVCGESVTFSLVEHQETITWKLSNVKRPTKTAW